MRWSPERSSRRQTGFSLLSAIFLLVVLSAAGAFLIRTSGVQRRTTTLALLGPKAYQAARSAIEWNLHQALTVPGSCPVGPPTTTTFALNEGGLIGFDVSVSCDSAVHVEDTISGTLYHFVAFAERGSFGERDYVSRRLETWITDAI